MAKKIPFSCVFASDEDLPTYPASELNSHGPHIFGWRSKPDPSLDKSPKEIVLKFHYPAKIYKIQVLAHQYLIPERIDLFINYSSKSATPSSQTFEYIGFISLSQASENFQSRELQSISIPEKLATHLKLRMGGPYSNKLNPHNQLALLAVNVLGEECQPNDLNHLRIKSSTDESTEIGLSSITDDLSYCMYVEESIVDIVKKLEQLKHRAVEDERFEYARKLKLCMNCLRTVGERLGRYALSKRLSVLKEDFNTARLRKEQMELYKKVVFEKLEIDKLFEYDGLLVENDICSETYAAKPQLPQAPTLVEVAKYLENLKANEASNGDTAGKSNLQQDKLHEIPQSPQFRCDQISKSSPRSSPNTGSLRRRNKSAPRNTNYDHDEREIPTLRHSHTNEFLRECHHPEPEMRGRSKLNDREKRQASIPILVFGIDIVELFYSRQFQDREEALLMLREILKNPEKPEFGYNKTTRGATILLHRAIRDAVFSVFSAAAETIRCLFCEFIPEKVSNSEVARCVDKLLPELLSKSGDASPRVHNLAQHTILVIATCNEVKEQHLVAPSLSRPVTNGTHPRLALSRMQMLEQLVLSQGINNEKQSGLSPRLLSECGIQGIQHSHEPVRKVAERILLAVYKVNPRLIRKQLPPDDEITRRNLLYRQLFAEFDKIDLQRKREMLAEQKVNTIEFSINECSSSETSGETSRPKSSNVAESIKILRINDRASPIPFRPRNNQQPQIYKSECERTKDFVKCDVCHDAILVRELEKHKKEPHCRVLTSGIAKCPLCRENIYLPDDGGYERHISIGCPKQKRKIIK
ncbi:hypothetical protein ACKWTF_007830 [Chironomus riparius]